MYAYKIKSIRVKEPDFPYDNEVMSSPGAVKGFLQVMDKFDIEQFVSMYLDTRNKLIGLYIQPGTINQAAVTPREVIKNALLSGASGVIIAHNHPSGNPEPSQADRNLTSELKKALNIMGIQLQDHLIVGEDRFYSFSETGCL